MYIWIGCGLPEEFENALRERTRPLAEALALGLEPFSLPQHISLKISFDGGDRTKEILDTVAKLLAQTRPFTVHPAGLARQGGILWITFRENPALSELHRLLDRALKQQFGIGQHAFDRAFLFHSTVYIGEENRIALAEESLRDLTLPETLQIRRFFLGVSPNGQAGTYRVVRTVDI